MSRVAEAPSKSAYAADPIFQQYYTDILASMKPQTIEYQASPVGEIEYQAPTVDEIASQISSYLRPAVDQQIRDRRQATSQQRAATDADAASRGILSSTWVTDIKNRLHQSETADIAAAESDYRSQLLQGVYNRQAQEADRKNQIDMFNAQLRQSEADRADQIAMFNAQMREQAEKDAYSRAADMYNIYLQSKKTGSGGGGGGSSSVEEPASDGANDEGYLQYLDLKRRLAESAGKKLKPKLPDLIGGGLGLTPGMRRPGLK